ncbi:MAG: oxidoreductase-like protein [Lysobacteraceae bacterium]|nr:MAG: oxidoreductase-like protein [Xanthomonadaceae bacterium]
MRDPARDPPQPPEKPLPSDCCDSGCQRCVFEIYAEELERHAQRLAEWRAGNPGWRAVIE